MKVVLVSTDFDTLVDPWLDYDIASYLILKGEKPARKGPREDTTEVELHLYQFNRSNPMLIEAILTLYGEEGHRFLKVVEIPGGDPANYVLLSRVVDGYLTDECVVKKGSMYGPKGHPFSGEEGVI